MYVCVILCCLCVSHAPKHTYYCERAQRFRKCPYMLYGFGVRRKSQFRFTHTQTQTRTRVTHTLVVLLNEFGDWHMYAYNIHVCVCVYECACALAQTMIYPGRRHSSCRRAIRDADLVLAFFFATKPFGASPTRTPLLPPPNNATRSPSSFSLLSGFAKVTVCMYMLCDLRESRAHTHVDKKSGM